MASTRGLARATAVTLAMVLVAAALVGLVYAETPYGPDEDPADLAPGVSVTETETGYLLSDGPLTDDTVGLVFYPGARVAPESYLPHLAPLVAERNAVVIVPEMPLNFAVFDIDAADEVMASQPDIERWYVGGHSLGGAMACEYADGERVEGLVLFGSYCASDLSESETRGLSVLGTADGVIDAERERDSRANLPPGTEIVTIEGMNHAQFGPYGPQRGDSDSEIPDEVARERLSTVLVEWFEPVTEPR
ncbi:alpha/beta hydrolase [Halalkalicoccus subterraneus]|uniref:alpha/beta hydrolase n=1 Tax=Halalkalicoccus subterraneus TaxID=2675002 RepID=UPI000EFCAB1C|nr:alpha/beta hydrolase [Halalkalicoccus subterraneus]